MGLSVAKFLFDTAAAQGVTAIGMGRTPLGVISRTDAAIAQFFLRSGPGPQFDQRVQPQVQMVGRHIGPVVPYLLLSGAVDLLDIVEVLLDGSAVGHRFENLSHARLRIGGEEGDPTVRFLDDDHTDGAAGWWIGGHERLVGFDLGLSIKRERGRLPAPWMGTPLGQADRRAVLAWPAGAALTHWLGYVVQPCVL